MSTSAKGDFARLADIRQRLNGVASPTFADELSHSLGEQAMTKLRQGFKRGESPTGEKWAPLKVREGQPLLGTGRLRNSFFLSYRKLGFSIGTGVEYASVHQGGTSNAGRAHNTVIPRRQMLPEGEQLGTWEKPMMREADKVLRRRMGV